MGYSGLTVIHSMSFMAIVRDLIAPSDDEGNHHQIELVLPNDSDIVGQISVRKYSYVSNGKQKAERKKEMKERGLRLLMRQIRYY